MKRHIYLVECFIYDLIFTQTFYLLRRNLVDFYYLETIFCIRIIFIFSFFLPVNVRQFLLNYVKSLLFKKTVAVLIRIPIYKRFYVFFFYQHCMHLGLEFKHLKECNCVCYFMYVPKLFNSSLEILCSLIDIWVNNIQDLRQHLQKF